MVGSNEEDWKKFNNPRYQAVELKSAKLVQSGIDPEESFNFFRGLLFVFGVFAVIVLAFWVIG